MNEYKVGDEIESCNWMGASINGQRDYDTPHNRIEDAHADGIRKGIIIYIDERPGPHTIKCDFGLRLGTWWVYPENIRPLKISVGKQIDAALLGD